MAAPAQAGLAAPNLVQNLQGLGQGQQARETILSLLQGTLASVIPPTTLSPPSSQPMGLPGAGAFAAAAPAPYAPLQVTIPTRHDTRHMWHVAHTCGTRHRLQLRPRLGFQAWPRLRRLWRCRPRISSRTS
jgi:hypothetical protein